MNVGIIGAGGIARVHAEAYARHPACRIAAVADVDPEVGKALAEKFDARYYPDPNSLLADASLEAVSVCLPHALHADTVLAAAAAGKHVLCEKPIATSLADADRMIAACRRAGVTLMVGFTHRFYPEHRLARQLLLNGAIGDLLFANDVIWAGRDDDRPLGWRGRAALNGGGIFMDNGIHAADRLRWWIGSEVVTIAARIGSGRGLMEGEEHGTALLGYANGLTATLQQAIGTPGAAGCCYVELVGSRGVVRVDTWRGVRISTLGKPWEEVPVPAEWPGGFDAEIAEFVASIREGRAPAVTGEDGRIALAIIQGIYRAARTDDTVRLPPS